MLGMTLLGATLVVLSACPVSSRGVLPPEDTGDTGAPVDTADTADTSDTSDTAACVPTGDALPAGVYGGAHFEFTVESDGRGALLGDCSLATVDAVPHAAGAVSWTFTWQAGYGLPVEDTAAIEYIDVAFAGTYCDGELVGTLTFPDGTTASLDVLLGRPAEINACL